MMSDYPERLLVKLAAGTKDRLKARFGNVSEGVRGLIEREIGGSAVVSSAPEDLVAKAKKIAATKEKPVVLASARWASDDNEVLCALSERPMTARQLGQALSWPELRVDNAVKRLGSAIEFSGNGVMGVAGGD